VLAYLSLNTHRIAISNSRLVAFDDTGGTGEAEPQTLSHPCPCCGGRMIIIETFERRCRPRHRSTVPVSTRIDSS
jgi:hypothetical protein